VMVAPCIGTQNVMVAGCGVLWPKICPGLNAKMHSQINDIELLASVVK
jgi:hypothetical protein